MQKKSSKFYEDPVISNAMIRSMVRKSDVSTAEWPSKIITEAVLYTGSIRPGLEELKPSRLTPHFGKGVYLTKDKTSAVKYSIDRWLSAIQNCKQGEFYPTLYRTMIKNLRFLRVDFDWDNEMDLLRNKEFLGILEKRSAAAKMQVKKDRDFWLESKALVQYLKDFDKENAKEETELPFLSLIPEMISNYYQAKGFDGRIDWVMEPLLNFTTRQIMVFNPANIKIQEEIDLSQLFENIKALPRWKEQLFSRKDHLRMMILSELRRH